MTDLLYLESSAGFHGSYVAPGPRFDRGLVSCSRTGSACIHNEAVLKLERAHPRFIYSLCVSHAMQSAGIIQRSFQVEMLD